jgi:hypothetical protein
MWPVLSKERFFASADSPHAIGRSAAPEEPWAFAASARRDAGWRQAQVAVRAAMLGVLVAAVDHGQTTGFAIDDESSAAPGEAFECESGGSRCATQLVKLGHTATLERAVRLVG